MNWADFFDMGGYAFYVWTSWGLTTLALAALFLQAKLRNGRIRQEIKRQIARDALSSESV